MQTTVQLLSYFVRANLNVCLLSFFKQLFFHWFNKSELKLSYCTEPIQIACVCVLEIIYPFISDGYAHCSTCSFDEAKGRSNTDANALSILFVDIASTY